jgi:hypothetical protein
MQTRIQDHGELLAMAKNRKLNLADAFNEMAEHPEHFVSISRWTQATTLSEDGTEWRDLQCPKCGCDKIVCEKPDLGETAKCYECGYEFTITENCFVLTRTFVGWDEIKEDLGI